MVPDWLINEGFDPKVGCQRWVERNAYKKKHCKFENPTALKGVKCTILDANI